MQVALIRGNFVRLGNISLPAASFREQRGDSEVVCVEMLQFLLKRARDVGSRWRRKN